LKLSNNEIERYLKTGDEDPRRGQAGKDAPIFYECAECGRTQEKDRLRKVGRAGTLMCLKCFAGLTG